jgi:hypothetical protein
MTLFPGMSRSPAQAYQEDRGPQPQHIHAVNKEAYSETDNAEVTQNDMQMASIQVVPVDVRGPVQTRELPAVAAGYIQLQVGTTAVRILPADPRRKSCTLWSDTTNIRMGMTQAQAASSGAATWLANVPLMITHTNEVWAVVATGTTTNVNLFIEGWTL